LKKRIIRKHVYKLVDAVARFSMYHKAFVLAQPAYDFALLVADYTASAFEEGTSDAKLRRLATAKRACTVFGLPTKKGAIRSRSGLRPI
jgi:hypothetical protein